MANIVWAPICSFRQRYIRLKLQFTEEPVRKVPHLIVGHLKTEMAKEREVEDTDYSSSFGAFVVLCSSKNDCHKITKATELAMDAADIDKDVVEINGDLNKITKFYRCRAFCHGELWEQYDTKRVVG